jgi:hypothetical protein
MYPFVSVLIVKHFLIYNPMMTGAGRIGQWQENIFLGGRLMGPAGVPADCADLRGSCFYGEILRDGGQTEPRITGSI